MLELWKPFYYFNHQCFSFCFLDFDPQRNKGAFYKSSRDECQWVHSKFLGQRKLALPIQNGGSLLEVLELLHNIVKTARLQSLGVQGFAKITTRL